MGRAGELSNAEIDNLMTIVANPRQFKIPDWFLNRKKDYKDGKYSQVTSNALDMKLRDDLERLKKIRSNKHPSFFMRLKLVILQPFSIFNLDLFSGTTVDFVTTGASEFVGNTPRPPAAGERPSVCPRNDKSRGMGYFFSMFLGFYI